jgi:cytochrome c peroxidase
LRPGAAAWLAVAGLAAGLAWAAAAAAHGGDDPGAVAQAAPRPGGAPLFEPPAPGSYELPAIGRVSEHVLRDADGRPARLPGLAPGQAAVVAFVYGSCADANGCPLALATLRRLDRHLADAPEDLAGRVRLVTVSFDPDRDRPARMAQIRDHLAPRSDWRFLTAADRDALAPVLGDYGQDVVRLVDADGAEVGLLRHVLRVFLVDDGLRIRNVYSAGLLDERILWNDLRTVLAGSPTGP